MDSERKGEVLKRFLTLEEAAEYLGVSESELSELSGTGKIPVYKIGGIYTRFKVDDLEAYRRKNITKYSQRHLDNIVDRTKDFFYFNDFYILSAILIVVILYFIFK